MKKLYIVIVAKGSYEDYYEESKFATLDKKKAELWVEKFNRIIDDNKERLQKAAYSDEEHINYFWWDYVGWDTPMASFSEIEFR
jgi:hypothetical protein